MTLSRESTKNQKIQFQQALTKFRNYNKKMKD